ncbi:MAG: ribosomal protein S18-alanine N-acetyltransferase [Burkholderiales bacterium]|nr:ribosomal protein S18-alanine N-acetyltransferase [Burkholderiales bacterium]
MSAVASGVALDGNALVFAPMQLDDIDAVLAIEQAVYPHPWSRTNFSDSLQSQYPAWVVRDAHQVIIGYVLVLCAPFEAHLLNIAVHQDAQQRGVGRILLDKALAIARGAQAEVMILEVRPSNQRALAIYRRYGFVQTRVRKGYYPAHDGAREDAIEMSLPL